MIELTIHCTPTGRTQNVRLEPGQTLVFGRERGDLRFPDDSQMSGHHLTVTGIAYGLHFQDEGSTNGTFLNGRRTSSGEAALDDELRIGQTFITLAKAMASQPSISSDKNLSNSPVRLVIEGDHATEKRLSAGQSISVGRTNRAQWIFPADELMSSLHFEIKPSGDDWLVIDQQSSNGTFVNDQRCNQASLSDGDTIRAGNSRFRIRIIQPSTPSSPRPLAPARFSDNSVAPELTKPAVRISTAEFSVATDSPSAMPVNRVALDSPLNPTSLHTTKNVVAADDQPPSSELCWLSPQVLNLPAIGLRRNSHIVLDFSSRTSMSDPSTHATSQGIALDWTSRDCMYFCLSDQAAVFHNGNPSASGILHDNDQLIIGGAEFRIQISKAELAATGDQTQSSEKETHSSDKQAQASEKVESPTTAQSSKKASTVGSCQVPTDDLQWREGPLSTDDLICLLLGLSSPLPMWLMVVDEEHGGLPSVPISIAAGDAAWMIQVESGWPQHPFLIAFSSSSADQILGQLLEMASSSSEQSGISVQALKQWCQPQATFQTQDTIHALLWFDGRTKFWAALGDPGFPLAF